MNELMNELHDAARRIAAESGAPVACAGWVMYVLEVLQDEMPPHEYEAVLRCVKDDLETRLQAGRW